MNQVTIKADKARPCSATTQFAFPPLSSQLKSSTLTCLVGPYRVQLRAYLLMLAGLHPLESGSLDILGLNISSLNSQALKQLRCQMGYLSGSAPLLSTQSGLMNVMLPLLYHRSFSFSKALDKAKLLLDELGCQFDFTQFPALLTSFQRSQLAMARALILDPSILIFDLPFHDLGAKEREKMADLLARYQENRTICMVGGLQYPHFLEQNAQQIIYIAQNKIIVFDHWDDFVQTKDQAVQALLI